MRVILAACVLLVAIAGGLAFAQPQYGARGKPQRIASLNLCLDQQVLLLADVQNIASVTWLAADPFSSSMAARAAEVPRRNRGYAEEILPLRPDLIVAGAYTTPFTVRMLRRAGYNVDVLDAPADLNGVRQQVRMMGDLLREQERATALVAAFDATLAAAAPRPDEALARAAIFQPGGFTAGAGAFEDSLLRAAGFANVAAEAGIDRYGYLSLEQLMLLNADFIVSPEYLPGRPSLGEQVLHHPALLRAGVRSRLVEVPSRLWNCSGPMNADAVRLLAEARR
jgi:iron complex transport system substrate-binding protein